MKKVDENSGGSVLSTFTYHYDQSEVAVEYQPSTTWTYYLGLGLDQVVLRDSGSAKQWYYRDGHDSTSAVADNSGNLLEAYEYTAQGWFQITNASGTVETGTQIANDILYTGRNFDYETGNYFYRARYYNPKLGRFISRDPLSGAEFSQGTNLYAYCENNFLNASDPTGLAGGGGLPQDGFGDPKNGSPGNPNGTDPASIIVDNTVGDAVDLSEAFGDELTGDADTIVAGADKVVGDAGSLLPSPMQITSGANSMASAANGYPPPEGPEAAEAIIGVGQAASIVAAIGPAATAASAAMKSDAKANYGEANSLVSHAVNRWTKKPCGK